MTGEIRSHDGHLQDKVHPSAAGGGLVVEGASYGGVSAAAGLASATVGDMIMKRGTWGRKSTVTNEANEAKDLHKWVTISPKRASKGSEKVVRLFQVVRPVLSAR